MSILVERDGPVCPNANGTIYTDSGYSWEILCNYDFPNFDLPSQPATSLGDCINACNAYKQDENQADGASCVAVVYGAGNPNGNPCYLKSRIQTVTTGDRLQYVARRVTYQIGGPPVYTSILPSASADATTSQSVTSPTSSSISSNSVPSSSPSSSASSTSSSGLPDGAKVGIGVGVAVVAVVLGAILTWFFCIRRRRRGENRIPPPASELPSYESKRQSELPPGHISRNHSTYKSSEKLDSRTKVNEIGSSEMGLSEMDAPTYHELEAGRAMSPAAVSDLDDSTIHLTGAANSRASVNPSANTSVPHTPRSWKWSGIGSSRGSVVAATGKADASTSPGYPPTVGPGQGGHGVVSPVVE